MMLDRVGCCFGCGGPPVTAWLGYGEPVRVCEDCAVTILPVMMARAMPINLRWGTHAAAIRLLPKALAIFWRELSGRAGRRVERCFGRRHG